MTTNLTVELTILVASQSQSRSGDLASKYPIANVAIEIFASKSRFDDFPKGTLRDRTQVDRHNSEQYLRYLSPSYLEADRYHN